MKSFSVWMIVSLVCLFTASSCFAIETMDDPNLSIAKGTNINDDLAAFGRSINIDGTITGDLMALGSMINIVGTIKEDAVLSGASIDVGGMVGDDLHAAGGQVTLSGTIKDNAVIAGGSVKLQDSCTVNKDLMVAAGDLSVNGVVGRNLRVAAGQITINGHVNGSVRAYSNSIIVGPDAIIKGDLVYTGNKAPQIEKGAVIGGTVKEIKSKTISVRHHPPFAILFLLWFSRLISLIIIGVILVAIAPRMTASTAELLIAAPWISLLTGFILLVVIPVLITIIFITIIGIPLALILSAIYMIMLYVSRIFTGMVIGKWVAKRTGRPNMSLYLEFIIGLVILAILSAIPILGGLISFAALLFGLGAFAYQRYLHARESRSESRA